MEVKKLKRRLLWLRCGSFLTSVLPLCIAVAMNAGEWFSTSPAAGIKMAVGAVIGIFLIALKVLGRLKIPSGIVGYGLVFAMCYLLGPVLDDLLLLSGMALVGEIGDAILFRGAIKRTKENITIGKTADTTSTQVEELFKKYVGSGRV